MIFDSILKIKTSHKQKLDFFISFLSTFSLKKTFEMRKLPVFERKKLR